MKIQADLKGEKWDDVNEIVIQTNLGESWPEAIHAVASRMDWPTGTHLTEVEDASTFSNGAYLPKRVYRFSHEGRKAHYLLEYLGFEQGGHTHAKTWRLTEIEDETNGNNN